MQHLRSTKNSALSMSSRSNMREELRGGYMKWRDDFVSSLGPNKGGGDHPPMDLDILTNFNADTETVNHPTISYYVGRGGETSLFTGGSMVTRPGELVDDDGDADENGKKYGKTFGTSISNDEIVSSYSTSGRGVSVY